MAVSKDTSKKPEAETGSQALSVLALALAQGSGDYRLAQSILDQMAERRRERQAEKQRMETEERALAHAKELAGFEGQLGIETEGQKRDLARAKPSVGEELAAEELSQRKAEKKTPELIAAEQRADLAKAKAVPRELEQQARLREAQISGTEARLGEEAEQTPSFELEVLKHLAGPSISSTEMRELETIDTVRDVRNPAVLKYMQEHKGVDALAVLNMPEVQREIIQRRLENALEARKALKPLQDLAPLLTAFKNPLTQAVVGSMILAAPNPATGDPGDGKAFSDSLHALRKLDTDDREDEALAIATLAELYMSYGLFEDKEDAENFLLDYANENQGTLDLALVERERVAHEQAKGLLVPESKMFRAGRKRRKERLAAKRAQESPEERKARVRTQQEKTLRIYGERR